MKNYFTIYLTLILSMQIFAQNSSLEEVPDFRGYDIYGNEIHLYDILESGQYVLINFFLKDDMSSQQAVPSIVESYSYFGCNAFDVFYIEISPSDNDDDLEIWANNYNIEYPTIGKKGGGNDISQAFLIALYPTVLLISPEKELVIRDLYPIVDSQTIITALEAEGIEPHDCFNSIQDMNIDNLKVYPNPAKEFFSIKGENISIIEIYDITGKLIKQYDLTNKMNTVSIKNYTPGLYFIKTNNQVKKLFIEK